MFNFTFIVCKNLGSMYQVSGFFYSFSTLFFYLFPVFELIIIFID
jgi:hypothetical protein